MPETGLPASAAQDPAGSLGSESDWEGPTRWLARGAFAWIVATSLVLLFAAFANMLGYLPSLLPPQDTEWTTLLDSIYTRVYLPVTLDLVFMLVFGSVAALLAWSKRNDGFVLGISSALILYAVTATFSAQLLRVEDPRWASLGTFLDGVSTASVPIMAYLFPDGRLVPRWTRWLALLWAAWAIAIPIVPAINPYGWDAGPWYALFLFGLLTGLAAQVHRYRWVSTPAQRQQTRWVIFGFAAATAGWATVALLL